VKGYAPLLSHHPLLLIYLRKYSQQLFLRVSLVTNEIFSLPWGHYQAWSSQYAVLPAVVVQLQDHLHHKCYPLSLIFPIIGRHHLSLVYPHPPISIVNHHND
jgi:hypothetical protein